MVCPSDNFCITNTFLGDKEKWFASASELYLFLFWWLTTSIKEQIKNYKVGVTFPERVHREPNGELASCCSRCVSGPCWEWPAHTSARIPDPWPLSLSEKCLLAITIDYRALKKTKNLRDSMQTKLEKCRGWKEVWCCHPRDEAFGWRRL